MKPNERDKQDRPNGRRWGGEREGAVKEEVMVLKEFKRERGGRHRERDREIVQRVREQVPVHSSLRV